MAGTPVTLRCTHCGGFLTAPAPWSRAPAWYRCPHCDRPVPVLLPRDPAPLFSWEVYPQLYPSGGPPRLIGPGLERGAVAALAVVTLLLITVALGYGWQGAAALRGPAVTVAGHLRAPGTNGSGATAVSGALVTVSGEGGFRADTVTASDGGFRLRGVPSGGIAINVSATGFAPLRVELFVSSVYASPSGGAANLTLTLTPVSLSQGVTVVETPYPDLESFVAVLWSGTSLLGIGAAVAAIGTARLARGTRHAWGVAGGMAGVLAPVALSELGALELFPLLTGLAVALGAASGAVVIVLALRLLALGAPEDPETPEP